MKVWDWRKYVVSDDGPPESSTRLVLLALSTFMDSEGFCFPSVSTLQAATMLSRKTVVTHLHKAREAGWIEVAERGTGKSWKRHEYLASLPISLAGVTTTPPIEDGGVTQSDGGVIEGHLVVSPVHPNSSVNSPVEKGAFLDGFLEEKPQQKRCEPQQRQSIADRLWMDVSKAGGYYEKGSFNLNAATSAKQKLDHLLMKHGDTRVLETWKRLGTQSIEHLERAFEVER